MPETLPERSTTLTRMNRRTSCLLILGLVLAGLFVVVIALVWQAVTLPDRAAETFGVSDPKLNTLERIYLSARLLLDREDLTSPHDPNGDERDFEIQLGESTRSIAGRLQQENLIPNSQAFLTYLRYSGLDTGLQAGRYVLSPQMTPLEIASDLQDATPTEVVFTILPGWRLEEIAANLPTSGLEIQPEEFLALAGSPPSDHPLAAEIPAGATLEGFFLAGSYTLPRAIDDAAFIDTLLDRFNEEVGGDIRQGFDRRSLSLYEGVTLASIVQKESVVQEEMPLIASVFLNRLDAGIKLDSDPTVQYALGLDGEPATWWKSPLSLNDLQVASPYNTYQNPGLPPGPIASPTVAALQAVAYPAQTPYFYFRAACDGSGRHTFAETFEEHLGNACE